MAERPKGASSLDIALSSESLCRTANKWSKLGTGRFFYSQLIPSSSGQVSIDGFFANRGGRVRNSKCGRRWQCTDVSAR